MSLLDSLTGGKADEAAAAQQQAIQALQGVQTPTTEQLTLPELQQYAKAQNMTPAQMQAFLQQNNALAGENVDQTGTKAEQTALAQLANTAQQGATGDATEQAQESQIQQDMGRTLAGQRGAIDQQAEARGVPLGLLQAALQQQNAGQDAQNANQSALTAQSNNYQTALNALAQQGNVGANLQGQQNTQANTVANAQNAMQQFNAANQQNASQYNAGNQQQANAANMQANNTQSAANTGLVNEKIRQNAGVAQQNFNNQLGKATGVAGQFNNAAGTATGQGQQTAGITSGLIGAGATVLGGMYGGPAGAAAGGAVAQGLTGGNQAPPASANTQQYAPQGTGQSLNYAQGGIAGPCYMCGGGVCMQKGGHVPGRARVAGDSPTNDTVHAQLSPGEAVIPRSTVQQNPQAVHQLLAQSQQPAEGHNPQDVAALLQAMKHLRGAR